MSNPQLFSIIDYIQLNWDGLDCGILLSSPQFSDMEIHAEWFMVMVRNVAQKDSESPRYFHKDLRQKYAQQHI